MKVQRIAAAIVALLAVVWCGAVLAQDNDIAAYRKLRNYEPLANWKVGDKVDAIHFGNKYRPATIIKVDEQSAYPYRVHWDDTASFDDMVLPPSQIRARSGSVVSTNTAARQELSALKPLAAPARGSLEATFQDLIRARYATGRPVVVTFNGFKIGQTYKYRPPGLGHDSPDGPSGYLGATIYPVSAQYTVRTTYKDAYLTSVHDERFACFKGSFKRWVCNMTTGGRGIIKNLREERPDGH